MGTEICEFCGETKDTRGIGNHREKCRIRKANGQAVKTTQQGSEVSKETQANLNDPHNDSLQNLKNVKIEAKPLGGEQAGNGISSPEIHVDSVPPEISAAAHQEDRKEKYPIISVSQVNEISDQDPDRNEENEGGMIWGAVAAFCALIFGIIITLYLWWHNRKEGETT